MKTGRSFMGRVLAFALVSFVGRAALAAAPDDPPAAEVAPAYTLVVDSDDDRISFDALAPRLAAELGAPVEPARLRPTRAAITIVYRGGHLSVRAAHAGDRVLERYIRAEGDTEAVRREAVLLASNLARDEARELLDELARRGPKPAEPPPASADEPKPTTPAPEDEGELRPVTVALVYPVATNANEPDVRSPLNFDLFYGRVGRSTALQLSFGGAAYASRGASGLQMGALAGISGGEVRGAQVTGVASVARGELRGAQLAGIVTWAGPVEGAQVSGVLGRATSVVGGQVTGVVNYAGDVKGTQATGVVNIAGSVEGSQIAGGFSLARGTVRGLQLASFDVATGDVEGAQLSGGLSLALQKIDGAQISSVNVAREVRGAQLGLVNVAKRVRGIQVGAVNVVEDGGEAIGLVTISRNSVHPIAWTSNLSYSNAGIKFTSRHIYTLTAIGFGTNEIGFDDGFVVTSAIGGHLGIGKLDLEAELAYSHLEGRSDQNHALHQRVIAGYNFFEHLRVFAGGGVRVPIEFQRGSNAVRPEIVAGVQF